MGAKAYSAGTIFLQVVPVFGDVQNSIRRQAKDINRAIGDELETGGEEAGRRGGKRVATGFNEELHKRVKKGMEEIDRAKWAELPNLERKLRQTAKRAGQGLAKGLDPELDRIKAKMESFGDLRITGHLNSGQLKAEMAKVLREIKRIDGTDIGVDARLDTAQFYKSLAPLVVAMSKIDGRDLDVSVDLHGAGRAAAELGVMGTLMRVFSRDANGAGSSMSSLSGNFEQGTASFRAFNGIALACVLLLPALVPVLGAVGGGLLALIPILSAVGAGFGTMLIGFSGIGDAVSALGDQADSAAKDSTQAADTMRDAAYAVRDAKQALADAERNAARAQQDAARAVADARRDAARSIQEAIERQKDAQEAYKDSVNDVREAEQALRDARAEAKKELEDLSDQVEQNKLDERQGVLDVFDATNAFNAVMADGSSTNYDKEQAAINLKQAQLRLKEIREEEARLAKEKKKADKEGIEGTDAVQNAQDALTQALEDQQDAQEALGEAARDVDRARIDGARRVADAIRNQNRAAADGARSVADAHENLRRAQENYAEALHQTGVEGSASMQKVEEAMGKLGPAGRKFARFIFGLRDDFRRLRDGIQAEMLPGVQRALEGLISTYGPRFNGFMFKMAAAVGGFFEDLSESLQGPAWRGFFGIMDKLGPRMFREFGKTTLNWMEVFASIMTAVAPYAERMSVAMLGISEAASDWAASKKGQKFWGDFMAYAARVGPVVLDFFENLVGAVLNIGRALAPWGEVILGVLDAILKFVAGMDPKTLGLIAGVVMSMFIAFQLAAGATAVFSIGFLAVTSPIGLVVLAVVALIGILTALAIRYEGVRKVLKVFVQATIFFVKALWFAIKLYYTALFAIIWWLWEHALKPVFTWFIKLIIRVGKAIYGWWNSTVKPALIAFGGWVKRLWKNYIQPYLTFIGKLFQKIGSWIKIVWKNVIWPILDLFGTIIWKLWKTYFKVALWLIGKAFKALGAVFKWVYEHVIKPLFDKFMDLVGGKEGLQHKFEVAVAAIQKIWEGLKAIFGKPIKWVIETVINGGLIKGFNKIAKFVGSDEMQPLPVPDWNFARGGVMPGYTPGRDVHHFTSPTGGRLNLSGGEAVMRPEFTSVVGSRWVDEMNAAARAGGAGAVRRAMGMNYFLGGVIPLAGARYSRHGSGYSSVWAGDLNYGSGYDDYGMPVHAWKSGNIAKMAYIGDQSYGRWVDINHAGGQYSRYAHLSGFAAGLKIGMGVGAGQTIGYVGDLGNTGNPPTSHLHFEINGGSADLGDMTSGDHGGNGLHFPGWLKDVAKNPIGYVKGLITGPLDNFKDKFGNAKLIRDVAAFPMKLVGDVKDTVVGMLPGPLKAIAGGVGDVVGGIKSGLGHLGDTVGMATGGIVPYNGTMKYDSGGFLPPGLTTVMNLTGSPEPVFTAEQFEKMRGGGDGFTYAPTFNQSDLTASEVMDELDFERRKWARRGGKYEKVG